MRYLIALVAVSTLSAPALAVTTPVFDNQSTLTGAGHCVYNTSCASALDFGGDFAAQKFSLAVATTLTGAGVTNYTAPGMTDIGSFNWRVYADGTGGLPGDLLATGHRAAMTSLTLLTTDPLGYYDVSLAKFALPSVSLAAGDYYFAVQAVTTTVGIYLSAGDAATGGAQTRNGGESWATGYQGYSSIAVSLYADEAVAAIPEPASWTLMIAGFGMIGAAMRRRAPGLSPAL
jgi:hypothetical protein